MASVSAPFADAVADGANRILQHSGWLRGFALRALSYACVCVNDICIDAKD